MTNSIVIWKKELRDTIRDKRTLLSMIILPMILMPAIIIGMGKFVELERKKSEEHMTRIAFVNESSSKTLSEIIRNQPNVQIVAASSDIYQEIKNKEADLVIVYPKDFNISLKKQNQVKIQVLYNSLNTASATAGLKVQTAVNEYNASLLKKRFIAQDISQSILNNVQINRKDTATQEEIGGFGLGFILPLFIIMWSVIGGQYTAIDVSAGEKERKTLEALLLTPVKRIQIVLGKYFAVVTAALISIIISISSMYIAISTFGFDLTESSSSTGETSNLSFNVKIEPQAIIILLIVSVLLVLMFSAIILSISIFAKSYKEAQSYIGPSYLIVIIPVTLINTVTSFKAAIWMYAIPAVNAVILFKEVLIGEYNIEHIAISIISLFVFAIIALFLATRIYQKEGVLLQD